MAHPIYYSPRRVHMIESTMHSNSNETFKVLGVLSISYFIYSGLTILRYFVSKWQQYLAFSYTGLKVLSCHISVSGLWISLWQEKEILFSFFFLIYFVLLLFLVFILNINMYCICCCCILHYCHVY